MRRSLAALLAASTLLPACGGRTHTPDPLVSAAVRGGKLAPFPDRARARRVWPDVQRFYGQREYRLAWSDRRRVSGDAEALAGALRAADADALNPADYRPDDLAARSTATLDDQRAAELDVRLTQAYLAFAADLQPAASGIDAVATLEAALDRHRVAASLADMTPRAPQYIALKAQLARERALAAGDRAAADRAARLVLNMNRWRRLPADLGAHYVMVNIPAFELAAVDEGRPALTMRVVVGKKDNPTPVLADEMTSVVFSPYWNIPIDIAEREMLPKLSDDPDYLERHNIEMVETSGDGSPRFRQRPGAGNSLGSVKFVFPNHFNVYLHDTPSQSLFNRVERDFSHGCVRVAQPLALARYVLRDQPQWTEDKITAAMNAGTERSVALKTPLPIYLVYFTAWAEDGSVRYFDDVYGHDLARQASGG
jgi:murein L,D-transpeptidase YcbB/YkuD